MAWIPIHQSILTHHKTFALAESLDLPEVYIVGHLTALWLWSMDNAPCGVLPNSPRLIAKAAQFTGDAKTFLDSLIAVSVVDEIDGNLCLHGWEEHGGKLVSERERNAQRMKNARAMNVQRTCVARSSHVHGREEYSTEDNTNTLEETITFVDFSKSTPPQDSQQPALTLTVKAVKALEDPPSPPAATLLPIAPPKPPRVTVEQAESVYALYPHKEAKPTALKAIGNAILRIRSGKDRPDGCAEWPPPDPTMWLRERVKIYALCRASEPKQFTPLPATWFNASRYSDDEVEWQPKGQMNGNGHSIPPESFAVTKVSGGGFR